MIPHTPELKHYDSNSSGYIAGVTYAGTIVSVSAIAQGTAANQRTGDSIVIRGIDFKINCFQQGTSTGLRFILFAWNVSTGLAAPGISNILQGAGVTPMAIVAPYDADSTEQGRLDIIADIYLPCGASPSVARAVVQRKLKLPVNFDAGATTGAGTLRLLTVSDAALAGNSPQHEWWCRILYDDV